MMMMMLIWSFDRIGQSRRKLVTKYHENGFHVCELVTVYSRYANISWNVSANSSFLLLAFHPTSEKWLNIYEYLNVKRSRITSKFICCWPAQHSHTLMLLVFRSTRKIGSRNSASFTHYVTQNDTVFPKYVTLYVEVWGEGWLRTTFKGTCFQDSSKFKITFLHQFWDSS